MRIGRAVVLPGDLVLAKPEGVLFIPAMLAEAAISHAEFTALTDDYNFDLNKSGANGAQFEGGWTAAKYDAFAQVDRRAPRQAEDAAQRVRRLTNQSQAARREMI